MSLDEMLQSVFDDVGPWIIADITAKKLRAQGVRVSRKDKTRIAAAFAKPPVGDTLELELGGNVSRRQPLVLRFTSADHKEFERRSERFLKTLPSLIDDLLEQEAPRLLRRLVRGWYKEERRQNRDFEAFKRRLRRRWAKPLGRLQLALTIARETGDGINQALRSQKPIRSPFKIDVVTRLQAGACQVGNEVLTLLSAGFADGAMARWRTLHEIAATALFIQQEAEIVAERYSLHEIVESRRAAHQYQQYATRMGRLPLTAKQMAAIESQYVAVVNRFGRSFKEDYGWAAEALNNPKPKFSHIEAGINVDHWRPYYKLASYNVHANPKGIFASVGRMKEDAKMLAVGSTNYGLAEPGPKAAYSLMLATVALIQLRPTADGVIAIKMLSRLNDEIGELFVRAQKRLEADTSRFGQRNRNRARQRRRRR